MSASNTEFGIGDMVVIGEETEGADDYGDIVSEWRTKRVVLRIAEIFNSPYATSYKCVTLPQSLDPSYTGGIHIFKKDLRLHPYGPYCGVVDNKLSMGNRKLKAAKCDG